MDLGCGTGVVSREASHYLGNSGLITGVDISRVALSITKSSVNIPNALFIEMDGENLGLNTCCFSKVICQYALMFFPNPKHVLKVIKSIMKKDDDDEKKSKLVQRFMAHQKGCHILVV